jgi:SAM-dependent methyltransferase
MANTFQHWQLEYHSKGIPSSYKKTPSGSMAFLLKYFKKNKINLKNKTALDLGCGTGRNSLSLIKNGAEKVYALDFVPELIEKIESPKIEAVCHDLTKHWPVKNNSIDIAIDIFCLKHQATLKTHNFYKSELARVIKKGGLLLVDLAGVDDGYYGSLPKTKFSKDIFKVKDNVTKVDSLLFTKESLVESLSENFRLADYVHTQKTSIMHGKAYKRSTLKFIFVKT